jgi:excisionase family DNA binding protein
MTTKAKEPNPDWLTAMDVARYFGIHVKTVKRIPPNELPYLRIGGRGDRLYRRADVEAFIERNVVR